MSTKSIRWFKKELVDDNCTLGSVSMNALKGCRTNEERATNIVNLMCAYQDLLIKLLRTEEANNETSK